MLYFQPTSLFTPFQHDVIALLQKRVRDSACKVLKLSAVYVTAGLEPVQEGEHFIDEILSMQEVR